MASVASLTLALLVVVLLMMWGTGSGGPMRRGVNPTHRYVVTGVPAPCPVLLEAKVARPRPHGAAPRLATTALHPSAAWGFALATVAPSRQLATAAVFLHRLRGGPSFSGSRRAA